MGLSAPGAGRIGDAVAAAIEGVTLTTATEGTQSGRAVTMFGEPVTVQAASQLSGLFTYGIPAHLWRTTLLNGGDGAATTVDGHLTLTSGTVSGGVTRFESKDHPRYEPDRQWGWKTASTGFPTGAVLVRIGLFTTWDGFFVEWNGNDSTLKAYGRKTTGVVAPSPEDHTSGLGAATTTTTLLYTCTVPAGSSLTAAWLLDQFAQWRGVGDIETLIDLQRAGITDRIGTATDYWSSNPALPFAVEVEATAGASSRTMTLGCVDVATYGSILHTGGQKYDHLPMVGSSINVDATERPVLVIQGAGFLAGMPCTRDHYLHQILELTAAAATTFRLYVGTTSSNSGITWTIPDPTRGIVLGLGPTGGTSPSATHTVGSGRLVWQRTPAAAAVVDVDAEELNHNHCRPIPGTLTTSTNRGDPAYGETLILTAQKTSGGTTTCGFTAVIASLY